MTERLLTIRDQSDNNVYVIARFSGDRTLKSLIARMVDPVEDEDFREQQYQMLSKIYDQANRYSIIYDEVDTIQLFKINLN